MSFTLVATARNEAPYFLEWVAWHRLIGFDTILVYQNDSDDLTHETLAELARIGAVEYAYNRAAPGKHQIRAYRRAGRHPAFRAAQWAMALDLDEFLWIAPGAGRLPDLIAALPATDKVLVNWVRMGHGGLGEIGDDLVTQRFTMGEPHDRVAGFRTPYKALFRPAQWGRAGVHKPADALVDESRVRICNGSGLTGGEFVVQGFRATDPGQRKLAAVYHYVTRDAAAFLVKKSRGSAHQSNRGIDRAYWTKNCFNDASWGGMASKGAQIRAAMADLDRQSGGRLSELRAEALALHRARFCAAMACPEDRALYRFCMSGVR